MAYYIVEVDGVNADAAGHFQVILQIPAGHNITNYRMAVYATGTFTPMLFADALASAPGGTDWAGAVNVGFAGYTTPSTVVDVKLQVFHAPYDTVDANGGNYYGTVQHS